MPMQEIQQTKKKILLQQYWFTKKMVQFIEAETTQSFPQVASVVVCVSKVSLCRNCGHYTKLLSMKNQK
jgi:hypothetical protein